MEHFTELISWNTFCGTYFAEHISWNTLWNTFCRTYFMEHILWNTSQNTFHGTYFMEHFAEHISWNTSWNTFCGTLHWTHFAEHISWNIFCGTHFMEHFTEHFKEHISWNTLQNTFHGTYFMMGSCFQSTHTENTVWMQNQNLVWEKQLARSNIDSNSKLLSSVCESFPSILYSLHTKFLILLAKCILSILIDPECSTGFSTNERYQNIWILVAKLFTIFTRTISESYAISWLECRQTNMFDAKTVVLYWTFNTVVTKFTVQHFLLCEIHVDPLMVTEKCNEGCMCNTLYRHKWSTMGREPLE